MTSSIELISPYSRKIYLKDVTGIYTNEALPIGIRFEDKRSILRKIADIALALFRDLLAFFRIFPGYFLSKFKPLYYQGYCKPKKIATWNEWKANSTGLHLMVHGFMGNPRIWNPYIKSIQEIDKQIDIRVPYVPKKGNCALEKATAPIREMVRDYIEKQILSKKNEVIPITLYGVSNGARIVLNILDGLFQGNIEQRLKEKKLRVAININAIAGVLHGTKNWKVEFFNNGKFRKWFATKILTANPEIMEETRYGSTATCQLAERVRKIKESQEIRLRYEFYSTTEDRVIKPHTSSLLVLGKKETHTVVTGEGHNSIVNRVRDSAIRNSMEWHQEEKQTLFS